eukprot:COSAG06_NODE_264_length_18850_cov_2499.951848_2_plen_40_part_00
MRQMAKYHGGQYLFCVFAWRNTEARKTERNMVFRIRQCH